MLTREQRTALCKCLENIKNAEELFKQNDGLTRRSALLPTNFMAFSKVPISKMQIPHETSWSWNQSNTKVVVKLEEVLVTFRKISPRRLGNASSNKSPSYKVWLYQLDFVGEDKCLYALWCEKGVEQEEESSIESQGINTPIGTIYPDKISLQSLSFLRPYVAEETAAELGWL